MVPTSEFTSKIPSLLQKYSDLLQKYSMESQNCIGTECLSVEFVQNPANFLAALYKRVSVDRKQSWCWQRDLLQKCSDLLQKYSGLLQKYLVLLQNYFMSVYHNRISKSHMIFDDPGLSKSFNNSATSLGCIPSAKFHGWDGFTSNILICVVFF